eukprot:1625029-Rhodomonas_salina.1
MPAALTPTAPAVTCFSPAHARSAAQVTCFRASAVSTFGVGFRIAAGSKPRFHVSDSGVEFQDARP